MNGFVICGKPQFSGEWVRLGELISKAKVARCGSADYPVLSMTMHDGIVEQSGRFKKAIASTDKSTYKVVNPGQLVVGFPIDEGVLYVQNCGYSGIMSPAYNVWNIDADKVLPSYLELALHSPQSMNYYVSKIRGTTARRRSMPAETLCELPISLPGHERQRNIVATLAHLKSQQDNAERQLALLDTLVKSRFNEMFEDVKLPVIAFGDCCIHLRNGANIKQEKGASGIPITRIETLSNGKFNPDKMGFANIFSIDSYAKHRLLPGDILISHINSIAYLGRAVQYRGELGDSPVIHGMNLLGARLKETFSPTYFEWYFKTPQVSRYISSIAKKSVNQASFSVTDLKKMPIAIPPISSQLEFAAFVQQVDKLRFMLLGNPSPTYRGRSFCCSTNSGNGGVILEVKDY